MQIGMPFLEGGGRAERKEKRYADSAPGSVPLEHSMESHKQPKPDEIRELVRNKDPHLS